MARSARLPFLVLSLLLVSLLAACPSAPHSPPATATRRSAPTEPPPPPRKDGRLPETAAPLGYTLELDLDPRAERFGGTARIDVNIPAKTSHIVLHARALTISNALAIVADPRSEQPAQISARKAFGAKSPVPEELVLSFERPLPAGRATLVIVYSARFDDEFSGIYRASEGALNVGFSQFEATDARRAFPCFDEPSFKVPFDISVTVPAGMLAVTNTKEMSRQTVGAKTLFRFARTLPLPTYLVALAFGDLEIRELARSTKPPIRLITTKGKSSLGDLALEATAGLVDELATWFGIPYPYDKLDIVAVPEFSAGAMENAGLITFRDELLLLDPTHSSLRGRTAQARVIAHELAHQWFGNLVTAAWWDDLWLNEGFATWMEARIVDQWRPAYGTKNDALLAQLAVMNVDSLASARAVRQPVVTTGDASEAFDTITYQKGSAVLATIEHWIGADAFQRGVRAYLTEHAFRSVRTSELFQALDRASGKDVSQMASTYLDRPGVPEVTAHMECDRGSRFHIELTQEAWRPLGTQAIEDPNRAWFIPVCVRAQGQKEPLCADLAQGAPSMVAGRRCPSWVHPNSEASYYRFSLPDADFVKLAKARAELDVPARVAVLANAWASVRAGKMDPGVLLKIVAAFDDDPSPRIVSAIASILAQLDSTLVEEDARASFQKYVIARLRKPKTNLGWLPRNGQTNDYEEAAVRRDVLSAMGSLAEDDSTLREAEDLTSQWFVDPSRVDSDAASIAVVLGMHRASRDRITPLLRVIREGKTREAQILALRALGSFTDEATRDQALGAILTSDVRAPDISYVLGAGYARRATRNQTEAWVRTHWKELRARLPGDRSAGLVTAVGVGCTKAELEERKAFYEREAKTIDGAERPLAMAIEGSLLCAELRAHGAAKLTRALLRGVSDEIPTKK